MSQSPTGSARQLSPSKSSGPAKIALIYAAIAATWIIVSDNSLAYFVGNARQAADISVYKGLAFVALTTFILYRLMMRMVIKLTDLHAAVEREQAAKLEALSLLEVIADKSTDAIYIKDTSGRYQLFNRQAGRFVGKESSEVIGHDDRSIFLPGEAEALMEVDRQIMEGGVVSTVEEVMTTPNGICTFLSNKGPFYGEGHQLLGLFGVARDITERKSLEDRIAESEKQYRSLFDGMLSGFAYHKVEYIDGAPVDFTYLAVNKNFTLLTGLCDVVGKRVSEVIPDLKEKDSELFDIYFRVADTGQPERVERHVLSLNLWFVISVFSTQKGYFAVIFDNITDRVVAQNEIIKNNEQLLQSNLDLEQFAYVSSHDLQTPLRNIISYTQLLERRYKGKLDADADDFIDFIVKNSKQMSSLISDLLEYSRTTSQSLLLQPTSASEAVAQALENLKVDIEEGCVQITVGDLPMVMAEQTRLTSLFQNLLGNGIKYRSTERSPSLSVKAERVKQGWWRFAVTDNGIGIEDEYHDKIFEIFQRLSPASERAGTGIGLALCRRIVHRFGGSIWVESEPGQGATFFFTLRAGVGAQISSS